jgi:putative transcriptional regulator
MSEAAVSEAAVSEGYLGNHFLVSMPQLKDDNFARTVALICQHNANGALGVVVNRLSSHRLGEVFNQLDIAVSDPDYTDLPVFEGGPVHQEYGLIIHSNELTRRWESSLKISETLSLTSSKDILIEIARGDGPEDALMSLGYAGWGPGQLEQEIMQNSWFSTPVERSILFNPEIEGKWQLAAQLIGMDYSKLTSQVGHA